MNLPVIQRPIDNTALTAYMSCPREYQFGMLEHRRPEGKSAALAGGSFWHYLLEAWYKGNDPDLCIAYAMHRWEDPGVVGDYRTPERYILVFQDYIKKFGDKDREITVGWPEDPLVEISAQAQNDRIVHPYAGKIDRPIVEQGLTYAEDHKTTSRLDRNTFSQYENSNQMRGYTWLLQQLLPDYKVVGVRVNLAHITKTKHDFHRRPITYTPDQIREWEVNYNRWAFQIATDTLANLYEEGGATRDELAELAELNGLPVDLVLFRAEHGAFPAHYGDNGCSRKYGLCVYHRVCSAGRHIRERILDQEFKVHPWNPLEVEGEDDSD